MVGTFRAGFTEDMKSSSSLCPDLTLRWLKHGKGQRPLQTEERACAQDRKVLSSVVYVSYEKQFSPAFQSSWLKFPVIKDRLRSLLTYIPTRPHEILRKLTPSDGLRAALNAVFSLKTKTDVGVVAWDFKRWKAIHNKVENYLLNKCFLAMQKQ